MVGAQPADRVLLAQDYRPSDPSVGALTQSRTAAKTLWVVNACDWVDVEYVLRRLLRCESTECHAFYSIGYVFFRSCIVSHVERPGVVGEHLRAGMVYRFPGTEVAIEIIQVADEGVVEVMCFVEYTP
jgi:hypothetical protein